MGQVLPLPERIPPPTQSQAEQLESMGVVVAPKEDGYCPYTLPSGWSIKDCSERSDLPIFKIVDQERNIRVVIDGAWKGTYDNDLSMKICDAPYTKYNK